MLYTGGFITPETKHHFLHPSLFLHSPSRLHPALCRVSGLSLCMYVVGVFISLFGFALCLSPVSRQWFYPMVGDIMLFYHRVEPRTGCWEVSASVRQFTNPSLRRKGPWEHLVLVLHLVVVLLPSFCLTCTFPQLLSVKILPCCFCPYSHVFCLHVICVEVIFICLYIVSKPFMHLLL